MVSVPASHAIAVGAELLEVKRAIIDGATNGDNTLVAAITGKKIRVIALFAVMTGTSVTVRFESGAGGTALTGQMQPTQGNHIELVPNQWGWFETAAGQLLNMELGGAQSVDGCLCYCEVPA